jgi:hypothetical protein
LSTWRITCKPLGRTYFSNFTRGAETCSAANTRQLEATNSIIINEKRKMSLLSELEDFGLPSLRLPPRQVKKLSGFLPLA